MNPILSENDWEKMLDDHYRVICLDVHADWCGPCTVMQFFFDKLLLDVERCDERVAWYSVSQELLPESIKELLPTWSKVNIYSKGCCPLFLFVLWNQVRISYYNAQAWLPRTRSLFEVFLITGFHVQRMIMARKRVRWKWSPKWKGATPPR